ncbi:MAG: HAD family hydrolase [Ardenticatenaceae bacterium]|nr:HAD family hydrolase [Ardenticatenaceae bacterium]
MTKQNVEVKGVFFDWELTLARSIGDVTQSERLAALFQSEGLPYSLEEIEAGIRYSYEYYQTRFAHEMPRPQTQEEIVEHYKRILMYLRHRPISAALLNRLYNRFGQLPTFLYDDTLPTLRALNAIGLTLGIISNHTRQVRHIMQDLVGNLVPAEQIFISQEVGLHKPTRSIFSMALQAVTLAPEECLFVGDSLNADAIGAVEQGGFRLGLWLDRDGVGQDVSLPANVVRITSLPEVLDYI